MSVLVTGASGFVGTGLMDRLSSAGRAARGASRHAPANNRPHITWSVTKDCTGSTQWRHALEGTQSVVHLAARVHVMRDRDADPLAAFRSVNVDGTLNLARQAADAGVKRFVFVSSIKVNGEAGRFTEADAPNPADPYGVSKLEAETGLREIEARTGIEVVIVRPPLVYGPGVKGNMATLMRGIRAGVPFPLGAVNNRRSLVGRDNLVDFIITCIDHSDAAGETFFVSDGEDMSTPDLIRRLADALGKSARLIPVPVALLNAAATIAGKRDVIQRLTGSLQLDISKARRVLRWSPPVSVNDGLRRMAAGAGPA